MYTKDVSSSCRLCAWHTPNTRYDSTNQTKNIFNFIETDKYIYLVAAADNQGGKMAWAAKMAAMAATRWTTSPSTTGAA
jgi:hypothetical protein